MTATYATAQGLANSLRLVDPSTGVRVNVDSLPTAFDFTKAELETLINQAEDFIDEYCNRAWRAVTVTDEYHDFVATYDGNPLGEVSVVLGFKNVKAFDHASADKIEVLRNGTWVDVVDPDNGYTEGRGLTDSWYCNYTTGILVFTGVRPSRITRSIKVTYRYGETVVPKDIELATILLAKARFVENDWNRVAIPQGEGLSVNRDALSERWQKEAMAILANKRNSIMA